MTTDRWSRIASALKLLPILLISPMLGAVPADTGVLIVDTHIDLPYRLYRNPGEDVTQRTATGDFDYPRARAGGLDVAFMSIYIPAAMDAAGRGGELANHMIDSMEALASRAPDKFGLAWSTDDVTQNVAAGRISLALGMENGGPLRTRADLDHFYRRGIRYVAMTHSRSNHLADSSYDINERWNGLSPAGLEMVGWLNELGIMLDVSHLSDRACDQVLASSALPVIASHSSARHFVPGFHRNLSDKTIQALAANGGVVQVNFGSGFISVVARRYSDDARAASARFMSETGAAADSPEVTRWRQQWLLEHPFPYASMDDVLDHIDHVVRLAGIDHVGIGSDFDGVGDSLPSGLKDVSRYPALLAGLRQRGYSAEAIRKFAGANLMRVWRAHEAHAAANGQPRRDAGR